MVVVDQWAMLKSVLMPRIGLWLISDISPERGTEEGHVFTASTLLHFFLDHPDLFQL